MIWLRVWHGIGSRLGTDLRRWRALRNARVRAREIHADAARLLAMPRGAYVAVRGTVATAEPVRAILSRQVGVYRRIELSVAWGRKMRGRRVVNEELADFELVAGGTIVRVLSQKAIVRVPRARMQRVRRDDPAFGTLQTLAAPDDVLALPITVRDELRASEMLIARGDEVIVYGALDQVEDDRVARLAREDPLRLALRAARGAPLIIVAG
jgi:hypothetical protein